MGGTWHGIKWLTWAGKVRIVSTGEVVSSYRAWTADSRAKPFCDRCRRYIPYPSRITVYRGRRGGGGGYRFCGYCRPFIVEGEAQR